MIIPIVLRSYRLKLIPQMLPRLKILGAILHLVQAYDTEAVEPKCSSIP